MDVRVVGEEQAQKFVELFVKHGYTRIDTARFYTGGSSEELDLGAALVDTKAIPLSPGDHKPGKLNEQFMKSKNALGSVPIRVFYLHAPDRATPFEETLQAVNELHKQGLFEEFGLSNFMAWEVAEVVEVCKRRGFILPTVYEGVYNLLRRSNEVELIPCLRKFGIRFAAYSILGGGLLTGKYLSQNSKPEPGSHFDPNAHISAWYISQYGPLLPVVKDLKEVADKYNIKLAQVASRWIVHHSVMTPDDHGAIIGASRIEQLESAIEDCEQGPLPEEHACDEAWKHAQIIQTDKYW